jgi:hypothetical protein
MAEMDVTLDGGGRLDRRARSETTPRVPAAVPDLGATAAEPDPPGNPPRRTLRSDLRRWFGTRAHRGRAVVVLAVLAVAVAGPLVARAGVAEARTEAAAQGSERAGAADMRATVEAEEAVATLDEATAADLAAQARAAHNDQRHRLAALGLNEQTIDDYLARVSGNAELVEYRRDTLTATVDRQAAEIPQMQTCVRVAQQALNAAWNSATFGDAPPPAPAEICRALLAAGT